MNKDLLMQPLSDEALADVSGGAGRSRSECESICGQFEVAAPVIYARCMANCISGQSIQKYL